MKTLFKRYIHVRRMRQILNTLAKYGFGYFIDQLGLGGLWGKGTRSDQLKVSVGRRLRLALEELGPTFVKLGQFLSTRPDILPSEIVRELSYLQDEVTPVSTEKVYAILEDEFGPSWEEKFLNFKAQPLAAASIGQVHEATLPEGQPVIIKVRRPGIEEVIQVDLDILHYLARIAQRHTVYGQIYDFVSIAQEFSRAIKQELDYISEGQNADRLRRALYREPRVYIPKVYWDYTTSRVLTMEFVEAVKLNDLETLKGKGLDLKRIARHIVRAFYRQILVEGFFHADPHPGNIAVLPDETIVFMDFGLMGNLSREHRREVARLVLGLLRRSSPEVIQAMLNMGIVPNDLDIDGLQREIDNLRERYLNVPLKDIRLGQAVSELMELAFRFRIRMPSQFSLLGKTLLSLESLVTRLDPELSLVEVAGPYVKDLMYRRYHPRELWSQVEKDFRSYVDLAHELPGQLKGVLWRLNRGDLTLKLEHRELKAFFRHLEGAVNKLSLSLIFLAFSILMSGLIISAGLGALPLTGSRLFFRLPVLEIGMVIALCVFTWLLVAILKGGRS